MTLLQEGNFKEIFKTDEGNFVQNEEKLWAKQEILFCKSGNPARNIWFCSSRKKRNSERIIFKIYIFRKFAKVLQQ